MSSHSYTPRLTLHELRRLAAARKLAMLTCYDAAFAATLDAAGVDMILIGDSLGMVVQGHDSTLPVTVADVAYHTACVARGAARPWIVADMPFGSFQASPGQAYANAVTLMQAGSQMVKVEGGAEMAPTVEFLVGRGIPVCAHIGLTPQHVNVFGGYRVQGRDAGAAERLLDAAQRLQDAGASMMVIEAVPEPLARRIAESVALITIGIGASVACTAQVLVLHDLLGAGVGKRPRFVKNFLQGAASLEAAVSAYVEDVRAGRFPGPEQVYAETAGG
ncbi:MAG: 3-methyl-2-oxobutanoate hydroxymethyltransferase [Burkholderiales bacterium]|nr:MAG: 3-methyl-2-oxobutanoate hydroxymethyltransferase [Burkholderiales bacterium]